MPKGKLFAGLGLALTLLVGVGAAAVPANASPLGQLLAKLINTDRIVGFPQHAAVPTGIQAAPGGPAITKQPSSLTVASGATATFTASASGNPTPTVQWQTTSNGFIWSNIASANSTTYSFTASSTLNNHQYRAVFSNSRGTATTQSARLTVTASGGGSSSAAPSVTQQPASISVSSGSSASFSAAASGNPTPTVQWQVSTKNGSSFSSIGGATSTSYSFNASSSQNNNQYRAVFTNSHGTATTQAATLTVTSSSPPPSLSSSSNWSGYADVSSTFSSVNGTWRVPSVSCSGLSTSYSAQWIGIDGYSSSTVEQDGTEADCLSGSPSYDAWYEMYGDNSVNSGYEVELNPSSYPVSPGDTVSAAVSVSGSSWTLSLSDSGRWSFSVNETFSAARSSAEWIVERPEVCNPNCALTSLANFGTVSFSNSTANGSPISSFTYQGMEMAGSTVLALPSGLGSGGNNFSDTWKASS